MQLIRRVEGERRQGGLLCELVERSDILLIIRSVMKSVDIVVGKTYFGKKVGAHPDRTVIWKGAETVQYKESDEQPWPTVTLRAFALWAGEDV